MTTDRKTPDDQATNGTSPSPTRARTSVKERVGDALFEERFQDACVMLNGLSMNELITTLDGLFADLSYRSAPLIAFVPQAKGIFKERLLAALYATTGTAEATITPLLGLLSADQQAMIRARLAAQRTATTVLLPGLNYPLGGPVKPGISLMPGSPLFGPSNIPPAPMPGDNALIESVKKALNVAVDGVTVKRGPASVNISVSGATAELLVKGAKFSLQGSPTGSVGIGTSYRGVAFAATMSSDRWDMQLTFGVSDPISNLAQLGKIFGEGEQALRNIAGKAATFNNLSDIGPIKDAIKPDTQPVKDAIDAAKGIMGAADARPYRPNIGITASGPAPSATPGAPGVPQGFEIQATITVFF